MKSFACHLLALLAALVCSSALATSSYYASLTTKVADACANMGQVYASTSGTESSSSYSPDGNGAVKSSATTSSGGNVTMYAYAKANEGYQFLGWATSASGVASYASTATQYKLSLKASTSKDGVQPYTYYAYFKELTYDSFSITFAAPPEGCSYTVDGEKPADLTGLTKIKKVTLATSDSSFNSWKINGSRVETNPYTFSATSATTVEAEFLTADKVATVTTKDELVAALANSNLLKVQIPSGTTITIPKGETVTVPSGLSVVNDGQLLVMGSLANGGKISGNGFYALSFIEISQGEVITPANAFTSYPAFRYCKTSVSTVGTGTTSGTAPGCAKKTAVRLAGAANWTLTTGASPSAAVCTVNNTAALNKITAVDDAFDSVGAAFNAAYPTPSTAPAANKFVVLLKDSLSIKLADVSGLNGKWVLSSNTKQMGAGFRVDCAGYSFTISSVVASSQMYLVNGKTITHSNGDNAYNSWAKSYVVGCTGTATIRINANSGATSRVEFYDCAAFAVSNNGSGKLLDENKGGGYYVYTTSGACKIPSTTTNVRTVGGTYTTDPSKLCAVGYKGLYNEETKYHDVVVKTVDYNFYVGDESVAANQFDTLADAISAAKGQTIKLAQAAGVASDLTVGSAAVLDLNGFTLSGPGKVTVSSAGNLTIIDTSVGAIGRFAPAVSVSGKLSIAYGTYAGALTLNSGSTTAIYNGTFTGAVTVNAGATASFRGGKFAASVAQHLGEGYQETKSGSTFAVSRKLIGNMAKQGGTSDLDERFKLVAVADSALYSAYGSTAAFSTGNPSAYFAHAEADAAITPLNSYTIDVVIKCDQDIGYEKIGFNYVMSKELPAEIAAGDEYRAFYHVMNDYLGGSQIKLSRFLSSEFSNALTLGFYGVAAENNGAICEVEFCLYNGSAKVASLAKSKCTLGARKNVAYIKRNGTPVFYSTLAGAVSAAGEGETVVLARESSANVTVSKAITINTKGFTLSGVSAGMEYKMVKNGEQVDIEYQGVVIPIGETSGGSIAVKIPPEVYEKGIKDKDGNPLIKPTTPEERAIFVQTEQPNGLKVWQNVVMGVEGNDGKNVMEIIGEKEIVTDEQGGKHEFIAIKTPIAEFTPPADTGVTVSYRLKKSADGGKTWAVYGEPLDKPELTIDPSKLTEPNTLWKFEAVFTTETEK